MAILIRFSAVIHKMLCYCVTGSSFFTEAAT